jgi:dephospho-CoA kinase
VTSRAAPSVRRVALTGGIATGKSDCLAVFQSLGVPAIDADRLAHAVVDAGSPGFHAVVSRFGPRVVALDGGLDRAALGRIVFGDASARRDLEQIIHPAVYAAIRAWFAEQSSAVDSADAAAFAMADIPLLYETHAERHFDFVVVAACRPDQQLERAMARGLSEDEARRRIGSQLPLADKVKAADWVIDTSGETTGTERQVREVYQRIRAAATSD